MLGTLLEPYKHLTEFSQQTYESGVIILPRSCPEILGKLPAVSQLVGGEGDMHESS